MNLRPPDKIAAAQKRQGSEPKDPSLYIREVAKVFVNGPLREAIEEAVEGRQTSVNVQWPQGAYRNEQGFTDACKALLAPLGYKAEKSHDGAGIYGTLYVSWGEKKSKPKKRLKENPLSATPLVHESVVKLASTVQLDGEVDFKLRHPHMAIALMPNGGHVRIVSDTPLRVFCRAEELPGRDEDLGSPWSNPIPR